MMDWYELWHLVAPPVESTLSGTPFYIALLGIGLSVGTLTGFFGVGGGFLVVPILNIVLGINYELAVGSSLSFIIGTSFAGLLTQRKLGNVHFRVAGYIVTGSLIGAILGDSLQMFLLHGLAGGNEALFTVFMHSIFIVVLVATIFSMRTSGHEKRKEAPLLTRIGLPPNFQIDEWGPLGFSIPGAFIVGLLIGVFTGLLGIGGGVLLVPVLLGLFGLGHAKTAGTSLAIVCATSIAAVIKKGFSDIPKVSLPLTLVLLLASVVGVQVGIYFVSKSSSASFRRYFTYVLLAAILMIAVDLTMTIV